MRAALFTLSVLVALATAHAAQARHVITVDGPTVWHPRSVELAGREVPVGAAFYARVDMAISGYTRRIDGIDYWEYQRIVSDANPVVVQLDTTDPSDRGAISVVEGIWPRALPHHASARLGLVRDAIGPVESVDLTLICNRVGEFPLTFRFWYDTTVAKVLTEKATGRVLKRWRVERDRDRRTLNTRVKCVAAQALPEPPATGPAAPAGLFPARRVGAFPEGEEGEPAFDPAEMTLPVLVDAAHALDREVDEALAEGGAALPGQHDALFARDAAVDDALMFDLEGVVVTATDLGAEALAEPEWAPVLDEMIETTFALTAWGDRRLATDGLLGLGRALIGLGGVEADGDDARRFVELIDKGPCALWSALTREAPTAGGAIERACAQGAAEGADIRQPRAAAVPEEG